MGKKMKQFSNTFKRMAGAMERETITKNRVSPKNDRSRNNLMYLSGMLAIVLILNFFSGCSSKNPSVLVGIWTDNLVFVKYGGGVRKFGESVPPGFPRIIELLKDGKAILHGNLSTTWEVSDKHLFIGDKVYTYNVFTEATELKLTDGGESYTYKKRNE
jgi:hypothetical protein